MDYLDINFSLNVCRRRTQSDSRAQDIVTSQQRTRKAQPDRPIHTHTDSMFYWTSEKMETHGFINWGGLLLFLCSVRLALQNLIKYGVRVSVSGWMTFLMGNPPPVGFLRFYFPVFHLLILVHLPLVTALRLEQRLSRGKITWSRGYFFHCVNIAYLLCLPIVFIHHLDFCVVSAVAMCALYSVTCLKIVSYIQVNKWCRDLYKQRHNAPAKLQREKTFVSTSQAVRENEDREEIKTEQERLVHYPANLTFRDLYYFWLVPTLCYELNFPRTNRIRKSFLTKRITEIIMGIYLIAALTQQWMVPSVVYSLEPFSRMDVLHASDRLLRLALPNHLLWLVGGYLLFHSGLNFMGELLQFGDRDFYHDWWNSPNFAKFWTCWNIPVHKWAIRHLYRPLLASGVSRPSAIFAVFLVSSLLHEYLVSVPLRMFKIWVFLGFMGNVPLVLLSRWLETTFGPTAGNLSVWLILIVGQPLLVMTYYHDYIIEHHGSSLINYYGNLNSTSL